MELVHGGDIYSGNRKERELIDFSANSNPLGMPESVLTAVQKSLQFCQCYPDPLCRELTQAIARKENLSPQTVLCGNGAADLIYRLVLALKPQHAMILAPTFAEYEQALGVISCQVFTYPLHQEEEFQLTDRFLDKLDSQLDLLFLCNPNNPTGQPIDQKLLRKALNRCKQKGIFVVLDECFLDFLEDGESRSMKDQLKDNQNLLILKAFTKMYAVAGLRLGYCCCSNLGLLEQMRACGQPWAVSVPAQAAGIAALQEDDYPQITRDYIHKQRNILKKGLKKLGIKVIGSQANYIFFWCAANNLEVRLEEKGILIRSCKNYRGLDSHYYRIAVKKAEENVQLLAACREVLTCGG